MPVPWDGRRQCGKMPHYCLGGDEHSWNGQNLHPLLTENRSIFVSRLFQISPDAVSYFSNADLESTEFKGHIGRVMNTLDQAVRNLDNLSPLLPTLKRLGTIHANLGIEKQHFTVSIAGSD